MRPSTSRLAMLCCIGLLFQTRVAADAKPQSEGAPSGEKVTFSKHIAPIVFNRCVQCHRPGEAAPFPLLSYEDVKQRAGFIVEVTESGLMPPWKARKGYGEFANDRSLRDEEKALIKKWVDQGAVQGNPADMPPAPIFVSGWQLGQPDVIVKMAEPFAVPATGPDIYQNFVVPVEVPEGKFLKAIEFRPSARSVTHHSLFAIDSQGTAKRMDDAQPGPGFAGLGFLGGFQGITSIGGWAVGGLPYPYPEGIAIPLPTKFDLVLQSHFHPRGKAEEEQSVVGLYLTDTPPTRQLVRIQLPVFFGIMKGIDIPAGEKEYTIRDTFTLPADVLATGISGHAHYICKEMKATATLPDGSEKPLIWIPEWDFAWQEEYRFKDEIPLPAGTTITITIRYDNSADNPRNPNSPPRRIRWGRESTDEMGSMTLMATPKNPQDKDALDLARRRHLVASLLNASGSIGRRGEGMREGILAQFDADHDGKLNDSELDRATTSIGFFIERGLSFFGAR